MSQEIFIVDAFTDTPCRGNPAAVCVLDEVQETQWMQAVAAEMNLSETAFLRPHGEDEWRLRWFTPKLEVDLCGHATLACAHVLWRELAHTQQPLRFQTRSGLLEADREGEWIHLDFPSDPVQGVDPPEGLAKALGQEPEQVLQGRDDLLVVLDQAENLRSLAPDLARLAEIKVRGVIVTALSDQPESDFVSRFFGPRAGIPEDPVTGSAHCTLAAYWGQRLAKTSLRGYQASARGGTVGIHLMGERVRLEGKAVTALRGQLCI
jgi:PhzF family phenazine biosynthesis protein